MKRECGCDQNILCPEGLKLFGQMIKAGWEKRRTKRLLQAQKAFADHVGRENMRKEKIQ